MTTTFDHALPRNTPTRPWLWRDLEHPRQALSNITPNWFAAVMGTGIVAVAATSLPWQPPGLRAAATGGWALAGVLLLVVLAAPAGHWLTHPQVARRHLVDPVVTPFHGAPPMALLTVGAGTLLLGRDVVGLPAAVVVDAVLWTAGTLTGLATTVVVPYLLLTRQPAGRRTVTASWLMPVVPPMVSASTGALLVPHLPTPATRTALLVACYGLFALAFVASGVVIAALLRRLAVHGVGEARTVPTLWIVLGPLGQSVTAANLLGGAAHGVLPASWSPATAEFGVDYGVAVWTAALLWVGVAATVTVRVAREHLPFSLAWWSFTFPVGTVVTGTSALALHTGLAGFRVAAVVGYTALVAAWATVLLRTAHGAARGRLLLP